MGTGYANLKKMVSSATDEMLIEMFGNLKLNEYSDSADTLVYTAMTVEMENRNLIKFNDQTWEYELIK